MPLNNPIITTQKAQQTNAPAQQVNEDQQTFDQTWKANMRRDGSSPYAVLQAAGVTDAQLQQIIDGFVAQRVAQMSAQKANTEANLQALQASLTPTQQALVDKATAVSATPAPAVR